MWNYCSLDKEALVRVRSAPRRLPLVALARQSSPHAVTHGTPAQFTFDLMDKDQGGTLSVSEVRELVSMIHGSRQPDAATNKVCPRSL